MRAETRNGRTVYIPDNNPNKFFFSAEKALAYESKPGSTQRPDHKLSAAERVEVILAIGSMGATFTETLEDLLTPALFKALCKEHPRRCDDYSEGIISLRALISCARGPSALGRKMHKLEERAAAAVRASGDPDELAAKVPAVSRAVDAFKAGHHGFSLFLGDLRQYL